MYDAKYYYISDVKQLSVNYTVNHKKCGILFLIITLANLKRFL